MTSGKIEPEDDEIQEEWLREADEGEIRDVCAARLDEIGGWQVSVWALANVREEPLEAELRDQIKKLERHAFGMDQPRRPELPSGPPGSAHQRPIIEKGIAAKTRGRRGAGA